MQETTSTDKSRSASTPPVDPLIGTIFDERYEVVSRLGGGGMGAVYEARHTFMDRLVALKVLHRHLIADDKYEQFVQRFRREARLASQINHPNAVTIYDFGVVNDIPYLAMEYVRGINLREFLTKEGPLPPQRACQLFTQIASAVAAAHRLEIIHRDLKPDNIMISHRDGDDTAHVLDFGIAKALSADASSTVTQSGLSVGTPRYMSPEQILGKTLDLRSDLYSLGVLLYEMLTGDVPFKADSSVQLMFHHVHTPPTPLREINPALGIPAAIEAVVMKAIAKEPGARFQSADEFCTALANATNGTSTQSQTTKRPSSSLSLKLPIPGATNNETAPPIARPPKPLLVPALVVAGVLIVALGFMLFRPTEKPEKMETAKIAPPEQSGVLAKAAASDSEQVEVKVERTPIAPTEASITPDSSAPSIQQEQPTALEPPPSEAAQPTPAPVSPPAEPPVEQPAEQPVAQTSAPENVAPENVAPEKANLASSTEEDSAPKTTEPEATIAQVPAEKPLEKTREQKAKVAEEAPAPVDLSTLGVSELIKYLDSEVQLEREQAAIQLQRRGQEPVQPLIELLQSKKSVRSRYWAAFILGQLRAPEAIPALESAQTDRAALIARTAEQALARILAAQRPKEEASESNKPSSGFSLF